MRVHAMPERDIQETIFLSILTTEMQLSAFGLRGRNAISDPGIWLLIWQLGHFS
jgi:hypothetical protein